MLRKFNFQIIALLAFIFVAQVNAVTPSAQQIEQFKSMPKAQQEALARQMGIDLSDLNLSGGSSNNIQVQPETQVNRYVDDGEIAARLAQQSANENKSKELKPFGYDLFDSAAASFAPPSNLPVPADYILGPGDSIRVQLFGKVSEQYELQVNNEGVIEVPDLGPMNAAGLSYNEFKKQLTERYTEQVIGVTPNISMGELRTIQIYMVGEAYQPGAYTVSALSTITNALFASGGVNNVGSLRHIQLKRAGKTVTEFDLYDLLVFGDTNKDMRLQQGDVIFIPIVKKLISVDGNVRRPAIYEALDNDTMAIILNIAGGLLPTAAANSLQVARSNAGEGFQVRTVDMHGKEGRAFKLVAGDFINVPATGNEFNNAVVVMGAYATPGLTQWRPGLTLADLVDRNSLLGSTDVDYALIMRGAKFSRQSEIVQFEPAKVLSGEYNAVLNAFDKVIFFNRFTPVNPVSEEEKKNKEFQERLNNARFNANQQEQNVNYANNIPVQSAAGDNNQNAQFQTTLRDQTGSSNSRKSTNKNGAENDEEQNKDNNFLQALDLASFTDKYLILEKTKYLSREELLAPIVERLQNESSQSSPLKLVEITGQVKFPGVYPAQKNANVRDLILAGGGLLESAYLQKAEISRTSLDNDKALSIEHITIDLIDSMLGNNNIALQSKDTLNVLRTPDWHENKKVELVGEVVFPGVYQIKKGETLAQLVERAGGFTEEATVKAVIFTREELKERERENLDKSVENLRQQIASTNLSGSQNVKTIDYQEAKLILDELLEVEPVGRLVIDMPQIIAGNPTADLSLKDGDKLFVPNISSAVSVVGEIFVPSTHIFKYGKTLKQYIANSGGETDRADMGDIYIVKADGSVTIPSTSFWFSSEETVLEPGDTIVVPRDVTNYERLGLWQTITQIAYQSAIALIAIGNL